MNDVRQVNTLELSITKIAPLIELIRKKGVNINSLFSEIGLGADILDSPDNKISFENYHALFIKSASLVNDPFWGLHAGESFTMMSNILGYVMMNCATAGEALNKYIQYQKLTEDFKKFDIIRNRKGFAIEISIYDDKLDRDINLVDYNLSGFVAYCRALTGANFTINEACFRHPGAFNVSEYTRIFQCKLTFRAKKNAILVPKEFMELPILMPNRELLALFEKHINEILKKLTAQAPYTDKVKKILINSIKGEIPSLIEISKHFSISPRSLQNKLKVEGTTYSAILHTIRKDMALEYLKDKSVSIAEISYLLGFSEPSTFHRSFKKWTNSTPNMLRSEYRENI